MDRLFSQFQPEHYNIQWDLRQAKSNRLIRGTATIRGQHLAVEPIRLHAKDLQIEEATVNGQAVKTSTDNDILTLDNTDDSPVQMSIKAKNASYTPPNSKATMPAKPSHASTNQRPKLHLRFQYYQMNR